MRSPATAAAGMTLWQAREMEWATADLERAFRECFEVEFATILVGGGSEPLYLPSEDPPCEPHRIVYREDYFASALHEVAHWCLAGTFGPSHRFEENVLRARRFPGARAPGARGLLCRSPAGPSRPSPSLSVQHAAGEWIAMGLRGRGR